MQTALRHFCKRLARRFYTLFPWLDGPRVQDIDVGYEKAGVVIRGEPVPWNADAVLVDVDVAFAVPRNWSKSDFYLDVPDEPPLLPVGLHPSDAADDRIQLLFRMPVPRPLTQPSPPGGEGRVRGRVSLHWRASLLEQFHLPTLSREEFLGHLSVKQAMVLAQLGEQQVPCEAVIEGQHGGLTAVAVLRGRTSLLPILDLGPMLEVQFERTGQVQLLPLSLTSRQLESRETLVHVVLPPRLRLERGAELRWSIAGQPRAAARMRGLPAALLGGSLFALDSRYAYCQADGAMTFSRYLLLQPGTCRLGPCFVVATREPGLAALYPLRVRIQYKDTGLLPEYLEQEVLITDGPSLFIPMTTTPDRFQQISSFDLFHQGEHLAQLSLCTRDVASFTSEGGFIPAQEYPWSPVAEEELADHLRKLMELPDAGS